MAQDLLGTTYYPSCVVNLRLRFDEAYTRIPSQATAYSTGGVAASPPTTEAASTGGMLILQGQKDGNSHITARIPKTCSVELPAYRQAGKFRLTFDYRDLPIDPRFVRAVGIEIYMDTVSADTFANSVPQVNPALGRSGVAARQSVLSMLKASPGNLVMQGLVDSWSVSHTSRGSEATLEGRDLIGMFLNTPILADTISDLNLNQPIDVVVRQLVTNMQGWAAGIQVVASPAYEWKDGIVPVIGKSITTQVATPRVRRGAVGGNPVRLSVGADPDKLNFWDVVTRWCYYVGAVPTITVMPDEAIQQQLADRVDATGPVPEAPYKVTLLIRPVNTIYDQLSAQDDRHQNRLTPFKDGVRRQTQGGESFAIRRMMYGRNIDQLNFERKYSGRNLPKLVRVVSYNPSSDSKGEDRLLEADYPTDLKTTALAVNAADVARRRKPISTKTKKASVSREAPSGEIAAQDILRISIPGISDLSTLQNLAKQIYEELGRGELGGSCQTKSLASFGAGNEDPDLISLRPGDGIQLAVDARALSARVPNVSLLAEEQQRSDAALIKELTQRLGDERLATVIVQSLRDTNNKLANFYRVSNVKFDWSISNGIAIAFDFHNYVEPRNNVDDTPAKTEAPATAGAVVPPPR